MITCDLCGEAKDCLQKEIAGKEYRICPISRRGARTSHVIKDRATLKP